MASLAAVLLWSTTAPAQTTTRVSLGLAGAEGNGHSWECSISEDGRYVVFVTNSDSFAPLFQGIGSDGVVLFDRLMNTYELVSKSTAGVAANNQGTQSSPDISADGRRVVFVSGSTNLVPGDTNNKRDVFVRDRASGTTTLVSKSSAGLIGNADSNRARISPDGGYIAFSSDAWNLVSGDSSSGYRDVFRHTLASGQTQRVSVVYGSGAGAVGNSDDPDISNLGSYVIFTSFAPIEADDTNMKADVYANIGSDPTFPQVVRVSETATGGQGDMNCGAASISRNGFYVAFDCASDDFVPGDLNMASDVFVKDLQTWALTRVSVSSSGDEGDAPSHMWFSSLSNDGRYVAFHSYASDLVAGDTNGLADVFLHDRQDGMTRRVSVSSEGAQGNSNSGTLATAISGDGRLVVFDSTASTLDFGDNPSWGGTPEDWDVFVHDRLKLPPTLLHHNGAWVTGLGNGAGGFHTSAIEAGLNTFGYGIQQIAPRRIADDFTVPAGHVWRLTGVEWNAYQTGSTSIPTFTGGWLQIWSGGAPGTGGAVLAGDLSVNRFTAATFSNVYRVTAGMLLDTSRPVMRVRLAADFAPVLPGGTYWVDSALSGTLSTGPFATPTVPRDPGDNARVHFAGTWSPVVDPPSGLSQDMAYLLWGYDSEVPSTYCTAKTTSSGCVPAIGSSGQPTASGALVVTCVSVEPGQPGLLIHSQDGPAALPFQGGFLCIVPPVFRLPAQNSGGGAACSGSYQQPMTDVITMLPEGETVHCQYWFRDLGAATGTGLSDGLQFVIAGSP